MKPIIGIISALKDVPLDYPFKGCKNHYCLSSYIEAIEKNGGIPLLIPILNDLDSDTISIILKKIDGLLVPGGIDVDPKSYNEKVLPECGNFNTEADAFQLEILKRAYCIDLPILGICRGIQIINVSLGGSLYQDNSLGFGNSTIKHKFYENSDEPSHNIKITKGTLMYEIFKKTSLDVNSLHHQSIKTLGNHLTASAFAEDNLIEAIEDRDKKFLLAVQFHPEVLINKQKEMNKLFAAFIKHC